MIVFNIYAVGLAIVLAIIFFLMSLVMPDYLMESDLGMIIFAVTGTFISGIAEVAGLRARLFWIPAWVLGLLASLYLTFTEYGWIGILSLVGVLIGLLAIIIVLVYVFERKAWANAPRELAMLDDIQDTDSQNFWEQLKDSFFFASMMDYTPEMCEHNVSVINTMEQKEMGFEALTVLKDEFQSHVGKPRGSKIEINSDLTDQINEFIDERIESYEENEEED